MNKKDYYKTLLRPNIASYKKQLFKSGRKELAELNEKESYNTNKKKSKNEAEDYFIVPIFQISPNTKKPDFFPDLVKKLRYLDFLRQFSYIILDFSIFS